MFTHVKMRKTVYIVASVLFYFLLYLLTNLDTYFVPKYELMRFKILSNYELQAINIYRDIFSNLHHEQEANVI